MDLELGHHAQDCGHMTVGFATSNLKGVFDGFDRRATFQEGANAINDSLGETGKIGDGEFNGFAINPFGFANEPSWLGVTIGYLFNIHGQDKLFVSG